MRIVQLANFYGTRSGGLRTAVDRWGAGYVAHGHEVVLVVPGRSDSEETLESGVVRITIAAPRLPLSGGYRLAPARRVADVVTALRPDALEVSDRLTLRGFGTWERRRGVHVTMVSHERLDRLLGQLMPWPAARRVADRANAATANSYDTVVCTTDFAAAEFERVRARNIVRARLGVDLDLFDPRRSDPEFEYRAFEFRPARGQDTLIAHCGRLSVEKRPHRSLSALAHLERAGVPAHLVIAGDGPMRVPLQHLARGRPVTFLGHVTDRHRLATLLANADISVSPGPHETFCLSALESLAAGTPVVGSRSSAVASLLDESCGAVAQDNGESFADAIRDVLDRPRLERERAARARATEFAWPASVAQMLRVHTGVASRA